MDDEQAGAGKAPDATADETGSGPPPRTDDSIHASVERLIASGKDLAEAEIAWARLKGRSLAAILERGLIFALVSTVGLLVGLSLLLVAAIVALMPYVGLLYATLIVIAVSFAIAALCGLLARQAFRQLLSGDEP